jgi:hypothetical protein
MATAIYRRCCVVRTAPVKRNQCVVDTRQPGCLLCGFGKCIKRRSFGYIALEIELGSQGRRRRLAKNLPVVHRKPAELPETVLCCDIGYTCDVRIGFLQGAAR